MIICREAGGYSPARLATRLGFVCKTSESEGRSDWLEVARMNSRLGPLETEERSWRVTRKGGRGETVGTVLCTRLQEAH